MNTRRPDPDTRMLNTVAIDTLRRLFTRFGGFSLGERCSQLEHARQCAALAESEGSSRTMVCAAFLHDIGHLQALHTQIPGVGPEGHPEHDRIGARLLSELGFSEAVYLPVEKHVQAKRYLASVDTDYPGHLSVTSKKSLRIQGGSMSPAEQVFFLESPYANEAIQLRRWDESGKQEDLEIPGAEYWLSVCAHELSGQVRNSPPTIKCTQ